MLSGAFSAELFICREADASSEASKAWNLKLDAYRQRVAEERSWPEMRFGWKLRLKRLLEPEVVAASWGRQILIISRSMLAFKSGMKWCCCFQAGVLALLQCSGAEWDPEPSGSWRTGRELLISMVGRSSLVSGLSSSGVELSARWCFDNGMAQMICHYLMSPVSLCMCYVLGSVCVMFALRAIDGFFWLPFS